ncbi:hypothetical protein H4R33_006565 [Dimargaris cristalligena]|nr:hypothetical protein H4R33_006565 [Dimargaris cristalligena]
MGAVLSLFRGSGDTDYEQVLADLDEKIHRAQTNLAEIKLRENKWVVVFLIYSMFGYAVYAMVFYAYLNQPHEPLQTWLYQFAPIPLGPLVIFYSRRLIQLWYRRRQASQEAYIVSLKEKQRTKVEELKKKTAYYSTRNLLERYDVTNKPPVNPDAQRAAKNLGLAGGPNGPAGKRPPMSSPAANLRQRHPTAGHPLPPATTRPNGGAPGVQLPPTSPRNPSSPPASGLGPQAGGPMNRPVNSVSFPPRGPPGSFAGPHLPPNSASPMSRPWYDKLVDKIVGDEGPETKYALICRNCFAHNGLALPEEIQSIQYVCPKCGFFNGKKGALPPALLGPKRTGPRHSMAGPMMGSGRPLSPPNVTHNSNNESAVDSPSAQNKSDHLRAEYLRRQTMPAHLLKKSALTSAISPDSDDHSDAASHSGSDSDRSVSDQSQSGPNPQSTRRRTHTVSEHTDTDDDDVEYASMNNGLRIGNITTRRSSGATPNPHVVKKESLSSPTGSLGEHPSDTEGPSLKEKADGCDHPAPESDRAVPINETTGNQSLPVEGEVSHTDHTSDNVSQTSSRRQRTPRKRRSKK